MNPPKRKAKPKTFEVLMSLDASYLVTITAPDELEALRLANNLTFHKVLRDGEFDEGGAQITWCREAKAAK